MGSADARGHGPEREGLSFLPSFLPTFLACTYVPD